MLSVESAFSSRSYLLPNGSLFLCGNNNVSYINDSVKVVLEKISGGCKKEFKSNVIRGVRLLLLAFSPHLGSFLTVAFYKMQMITVVCVGFPLLVSIWRYLDMSCHV